MKLSPAILIIITFIFFVQCKVQKVVQTEKENMENNIEIKEQVKETAEQEVQKIKAPVALKKDSVLEIHGDTRTDPYYWMRLSDDQKNADTPDTQTQQVLDYLNAENTYTKSNMKATEQLQEKLFDEIVGRIKKDDESVPFFENGYWYYSRFEAKKEYPIYCRKKESLDNEEEILLEVNDMAKGHDYYRIGGFKIYSPFILKI